jgi:D-serine deaminase-like pyridoxal phosphate-dependent protein
LDAEYFPLPGTPVDELDTPALVIDMDAAELNIATLQDAANSGGFDVRPHVKTHKSPFWALRQVAAGAIGVCAAKVGEAEAMVAGGVTDVLIANEIVGPTKIARLVALASRARITVAVDDVDNVRDLSDAAVAAGREIGVVVDVNTRLNRCGVEPGEPATTLATIADASPGLRFDGLMGYEGHIGGTPEEMRAETMRAMEKFLAAHEELVAAGLPVTVMTAGGTSTYDVTGGVPEVTDVQCGTYIFMDGAYGPERPEFTPALTVLAGVMSKPAADRAILDIGLKSVSVDSGLPQVVGVPGAELVRLSEEHGILRLEGDARDLRVGDRVHLRPMHGDTTINLHSHYFGVRNGLLEDVIAIAARGRFR